MAFSNQRAVSDGSLQTIILSIAFFDKNEIHVYVDDVEKFVDTDFIWATSNSIQFPANLPSSTTVIIRRVTDISEMRHIFTAGAQFTNQTLDEDYTQILHIAQESVEGSYTTELFNDLDMHGYRVRNMGEAVLVGDAVPLGQVQAIVATSPDLGRAVRAPAYEGPLPELPATAARANKVMGFDAAGNPFALLPATGSGTELALDLANYLDHFKGSGMVGHLQVPLAVAVNNTVSKKLSQLQFDLWDVSNLVTVRPNPTDASTWDWTVAMEAAQVAVAALGGGRITMGSGGVYQASRVTQRRFVVVDGQGAAELKQLGGSNQDFLVSENFAALTLTGATVAGSGLVPSWYGLKDIRVNGNKYHATLNPTGNTSGRAIVWYGPALIMQGNVVVYGAAGDNIYTEYSNTSGSSGWQGQEEGQFDNVFSRDAGGVAWLFRGPHNSRLNSYTAGFNGGFGLVSESGATFDGGFDWIGSIHTYANGRSVFPAADTGIKLGEIARVGAMITDGDNAILSGSNIQIGSYRGYNLGGEMDGLTISGNAVQIGSINAVVWVDSVNRTAIKITGTRTKIGTLDLVTNNPANDAVVVTGTSNQILSGYVQGFSGAGKTGLALSGSKHNIDLEITGCATAFNYTAGNNNRVSLEINTAAGQLPVAGNAPGVTDRFSVRAGGAVAGGLKAKLKTGLLAMDITTNTVVTMAHGLLYAPLPEEVNLTWLVSSPDSSAWGAAFMRVVTCTATDVVIAYKLDVAAPAGTKARIGILIDIT